jgi:chemotaxis signal transduction protein
VTTDNDKLRALASAAGDPAPDSTVRERVRCSLLVFRVGARMFGAEARHVFEVVVSGQITQVPTSRSHVLGITLVRGRVVPVISLGELLGFEAGDEVAPTLPRLLIVRDGTLEIALISDATLGLYDVDATDLGAPSGGRRDCIAGELEFRGKLLFKLDMPALLRSLTEEDTHA